MRAGRSTPGISALFAVFAATACIAPASAAERIIFPCAGEINSSGVNVRAGRSLNYEIVAKLDNGARVTVTGLSGGWFKILPPEGTRFWVASRYIEDGRVACGRLNVRPRPTLRSTVVFQLSRGDRVEAIEEGEEWTAIEPPAGVGCWVSSELVDLIPEDEGAGEPAVQAAGMEKEPELREQRVATAAVSPEERKGPCVFEGIVQKLEERPAPGVRFRLVRGFPFRRMECAITSETINIAYFEGDRVKVWGYELWRLPSGVPVVDVRRLEVQ